MAVNIMTLLSTQNEASIHTFQIKQIFTQIHAANPEIIKEYHQPV
jgi:hypothetical protein